MGRVANLAFYWGVFVLFTELIQLIFLGLLSVWRFLDPSSGIFVRQNVGNPASHGYFTPFLNPGAGKNIMKGDATRVEADRGGLLKVPLAVPELRYYLALSFTLTAYNILRGSCGAALCSEKELDLILCCP